jgi:hypothetical protein
MSGWSNRTLAFMDIVRLTRSWRHRMLARLTLLGAIAFSAANLAAQPAPRDGARWLAGCWELKRGDRSTTEMWMPRPAT